MGQYYKIVNLTKKEYFNTLGGKKLTDWCFCGDRTIAFLYHLLQTSWKEDVVVVAGDYFHKEKNQGHYDGQLYAVDQDELFKEISYKDYEFNTISSFRIVQKGMFINYTKREFIDLTELPKSRILDIPSPIALMIALGNDEQEGGDYTGINKFIVGRWGFDKVGIEPQADVNDLLMKGFSCVKPNFMDI